MADNQQTGFLQSIKGKIIIASVLSCFALLLAWGISKIAFRQMLSAVENISAPNDRLRLVNELSRKITQLNQQQKSQLLHNTAKYYGFTKGPKPLVLTIDTLKTLYAGDSVQLSRLNSLKKLLTDRDRLFINYLNVREVLVNNQSFSVQVQSLNELLNQSAKQNDSTVTTTEKKISTTTVFPSKTKEVPPHGFFNKLFGKKKSENENSEPYKIVNEELNIKHDTLARDIKDSIFKSLEQIMQEMEKAQQNKSALFVKREAILTNANNKLIRQIQTILKQVETETVAQIELNNRSAKNAVSTGVQRISLIMLAFFLLTIILLYFILIDIARNNRYRKEIEQARDEAEYHGKAKHRFLSNMSHEIRTPLQSIIGYVELIKQQEHPRKKDIDAIYHSSAHLMQIVNEVLDYNRIISGKFTFSTQVFSMAALLNEVISVIRLQAEKKAITIVTDYNINETAYISGDPFRLKQILYNLLGNAIKFTDAGEVKLTVSCDEQQRYRRYNFAVTDTGIGLSEQDIKRIFNEFEQVESQTSNHLAGTGLGLTISKALIESQGGNIQVKSKKGAGSSFTFSLDYEKAEKPMPEFEQSLSILTASNHSKVWIIDDDTFILDLCCMIFEKNNIPYKCFNTPDEILNEPWDHAVKYILLDIRMPVMSGIEICALLRKKIPAGILIYALTAQVMPGERELALSQGFDGLLMKPFKEYDLLALFNQTSTDPVNDGLPPIELDLSRIEKMTFDDRHQLMAILGRFIKDCDDDTSELKQAMEKPDYEKAVLLVHRIAGRTSQIGAASLGEEFRLTEMELYKDKQLSDDNIISIWLLTEKLKKLTIQIKVSYLNNVSSI